MKRKLSKTLLLSFVRKHKEVIITAKYNKSSKYNRRRLISSTDLIRWDEYNNRRKPSVISCYEKSNRIPHYPRRQNIKQSISRMFKYDEVYDLTIVKVVKGKTVLWSKK